MSVPCFLVLHPRGVLLFDTGLSDRLVGRPLYENIDGGYGQIKFNTLRGQLADIGVAPSDITYLAISHSHFDHVGNANDYAGATWLTQKAERDFMFGPGADRAYLPLYDALAHAHQVVFEGDHDVFGDGTVILKFTPGHTPVTRRCTSASPGRAASSSVVTCTTMRKSARCTACPRKKRPPARRPRARRSSASSRRRTRSCGSVPQHGVLQNRDQVPRLVRLGGSRPVPMDLLPFGTTALRVSRLCLGTMSIGRPRLEGVGAGRGRARCRSCGTRWTRASTSLTWPTGIPWVAMRRSSSRSLLRMTTRDRLVLATKVFYPMSDDPEDRGLSRGPGRQRRSTAR